MHYNFCVKKACTHAITIPLLHHCALDKLVLLQKLVHGIIHFVLNIPFISNVLLRRDLLSK
jgi:hypothetical protein